MSRMGIVPAIVGESGRRISEGIYNHRIALSVITIAILGLALVYGVVASDIVNTLPAALDKFSHPISNLPKGWPLPGDGRTP